MSYKILENFHAGVVRAIDPQEHVFYIVTPLSPNDLQKVNTLLRGSLDFPEQLLINQVCPLVLEYLKELLFVCNFLM